MILISLMRICSNVMKPVMGFLFLVLAAAASAETLVFQDTFDAPDDVDVNVDLDTRQEGGAVLSDYRKGGGDASQSAIVSGQLERVGPGRLDVTTDFADRIAGKSFSISVDIQYASPGVGGWGAISLLSDTGTERALSPLSIRLQDVGAGLVVVHSGRVGEPAETQFSAARLEALLGAPFDFAEPHNYKYVVTEGGAVDRVAFFIDGVEVPLMDDTIDFGDDTSRRINFINTNEAATDIFYDNLALVEETVP